MKHITVTTKQGTMIGLWPASKIDIRYIGEVLSFSMDGHIVNTFDVVKIIGDTL